MADGTNSHSADNVDGGDDDDVDGDKLKEEQTGEKEEERVSVGTYQTLSTRGGVAEGEVTSSPGCSGMSVSAGEPGPCMPGGVEEVLRTSVDEPLRDTQEVSMTRTPILQTNTRTESHSQWRVSGESRRKNWEEKT